MRPLCGLLHRALKIGTLAALVAADRIAAASDGRVALALKIVADRIVENIGGGIVIDFHVTVYFVFIQIAFARIVASDIAANDDTESADPRSAVLNLDIAANGGGSSQEHSETLIGV